MSAEELLFFKGKRILIIEDDLGMRKNILYQMNQFGSIPEVAETIERALDAHKDKKFDIVVFDVHKCIDNISCIEFINGLKQVNSDVYIIGIFDYFEHDQRDELIGTGIHNVVSKQQFLEMQFLSANTLALA